MELCKPRIDTPGWSDTDGAGSGVCVVDYGKSQLLRGSGLSVAFAGENSPSKNITQILHVHTLKILLNSLIK